MPKSTATDPTVCATTRSSIIFPYNLRSLFSPDLVYLCECSVSLCIGVPNGYGKTKAAVSGIWLIVNWQFVYLERTRTDRRHREQNAILVWLRIGAAHTDTHHHQCAIPHTHTWPSTANERRCCCCILRMLFGAAVGALIFKLLKTEKRWKKNAEKRTECCCRRRCVAAVAVAQTLRAAASHRQPTMKIYNGRRASNVAAT